MGASPNGLNINEGVGSTHPDALAKFVIRKRSRYWFAFDGDGDRFIAVDEKVKSLTATKLCTLCA